jgi:hypothetical protein
MCPPSEPPNWSRLLSGRYSPVSRFPLELGEGVKRQEGVALEELVGAAVEFVRAGLGLDRDQGRRGLAELGVVVLGRELRLRDGLQRRVHHDEAEDRVAVVDPVELVADVGEALPVHQREVRALRVLRDVLLPLHGLGAGGEEDELGEVAVQHRQLGHLLALEGGGDVGPVRLEQLALRGLHHQMLADLAHGEVEVDPSLGVHAHDHRRDHLRLEAAQLGLDLGRAGAVNPSSATRQVVGGPAGIWATHAKS